MSDEVFVDTSVPIYAHDVDAGTKHAVAAGLVEDLWASRLGSLGTQVLQEFYVNVTRKIPVPLSRAVARDIVTSYAVWQVEPIDVDRVREASKLEERHRLSFRGAHERRARGEPVRVTSLSPPPRPGRRVAAGSRRPVSSASGRVLRPPAPPRRRR